MEEGTVTAHLWADPDAGGVEIKVRHGKKPLFIGRMLKMPDKWWAMIPSVGWKLVGKEEEAWKVALPLPLRFHRRVANLLNDAAKKFGKSLNIFSEVAPALGEDAREVLERLFSPARVRKDGSGFRAAARNFELNFGPKGLEVYVGRPVYK